MLQNEIIIDKYTMRMYNYAKNEQAGYIHERRTYNESSYFAEGQFVL